MRDIVARDLSQLERLFRAQRFEYELPDLTAAEFIAKIAAVDEQDIPRLTVCARQTSELYLLGDQTWETPGWRFQALKRVHETMRRRLQELGISDTHIWIPPHLAKSFGRRLMRDFGWRQPLWMDFTRSTSP